MKQSSELRISNFAESRGIVAAVSIKDDVLDINVKGRSSGKMAGGGHGDHTSAQIISVHGMRRVANGKRVENIGDLRGMRDKMYAFISSIAVLNGYRPQPTAMDVSNEIGAISPGKSAETSTAVSPPNYVVDENALKGFYAAVHSVLDEYNIRRNRGTGLSILEKVMNYAINEEDISSKLSFSEPELALLSEKSGLQSFCNEQIQKGKEANKYLICETFEKLIQITSTYYYNIPGTAYPVIDGYQASLSEGGNINPAFSKLEVMCERLSSLGAASSNNARVLDNIAAQSARDELLSRNKELTNINSKVEAATSGKADARESLSMNKKRGLETGSDAKELAKVNQRKDLLIGKIAKLDSIEREGEPLRYIALKLKDLFHYPEITNIDNNTSTLIKRARNNDREEFYDKIAKHLFIVFNVYPELIQGAGDKDKIVQLFLQEVIYHKTDLGEKQGWPSLEHNGAPGNELANHMNEVSIRIDELDEAKRANLYQNTLDYRSRASSGALEDIKEKIIDSTIDFIHNKFAWDNKMLGGLRDRLVKLVLKENDIAFKSEITYIIQEHYSEYISTEGIVAIESHLGCSQESNINSRGNR